jgi:hypothetical protein
MLWNAAQGAGNPQKTSHNHQTPFQADAMPPRGSREQQPQQQRNAIRRDAGTLAAPRHKNRKQAPTRSRSLRTRRRPEAATHACCELPGGASHKGPVESHATLCTRPAPAAASRCRSEAMPGCANSSHAGPGEGNIEHLPSPCQTGTAKAAPSAAAVPQPRAAAQTTAASSAVCRRRD